MTQAIATHDEHAVQTGIVLIPLNKLKKSPANARKTPHAKAEIEALAASIHAKGILQNLVVAPELSEAGAPSERDAAGLQQGALIAIEPKAGGGRGTRVKVDRLSQTPLATQIEAPAETELDREIVRQLAGEPPRLPNTREVSNAITERIGWHQREGNGGRDLTGRFEFNHGALERLRTSEFSRAEDALMKATGKRAINVGDGLEREWRVRGFVQLQQGRFAMLERNDGVALLRVTRSLSLKQGKAYSLSITNGKVKATPSLGLDR